MRGVLRRSLCVLLSLVGVAVVTELGLRRFLPFGDVLVEPDAELLFRARPGAGSVGIDVDGRWVVTRLNRVGLRGPELRAKSEDRLRIAVFGDSLVQATRTPRTQTFPARLAAECREIGVDVETLNAGVSGYGPDQSLLRFEAEVDELEPDLVLLVICAQNDVRDMLRNKLFQVNDEGELVRHRTGIPAEVSRRYEELTARRAWPITARLVRGVLRGDTRPRRATRLPPAELARRRPRGHARFDADAQRQMTAILKRFRDGARERDATFALVVVPSSFDVVDGFVPDPSPVPAYDRRWTTDTFSAIAAQLEVPCLDLYDALHAHQSADLFLPGDFHWSPAGQAFAAQHTSAFLVSSGLLDEPGESP